MTSQIQKQYSLGYFNMARGLGILFVLAGHSLALFYADFAIPVVSPFFGGAGRVFGGGVMAMFFMISGFYFYHRSPLKCVKIQSRLLLKPYCVTAVCIILASVVRYLMSGKNVREMTIRMLLTYAFGFNALNGEQFLGYPIGTVSIFWFVLALFEGWVLFNLICWIPKKSMRIASVFGCVLLSWLLSKLSSVWPWSIHSGLLAVGYIAVGYLIKKYDLLKKKLPKAAWAAILTVSLVCLAFGSVDIAPGLWKLGPVDILGSFCVGFLLMRVYCRIMDLGIVSKGTDFIERIGLNSIWFLCLHAFEKFAIPWNGLSNLFPGRPILCFLICFVARLMLVMVLFQLIMWARRLLWRKQMPKVTLTDA